ncbi:hypothetical protein [Cupriavidus pauculus]|uniref:hypothetical protein n=1 Tax=Cupriavidus pauculus TaxID=82633 RepID=UPI00385757F0
MKSSPASSQLEVFAGKSKLATHPTEAAARRDMEANRSLYEYWAGSASTSIENAPARTVLLSL